MKKACVFFADGTEEVEGLMVVDLLRRGGIHVTTVSIMGRGWVKTSHDIEMKTDKMFDEVDYGAQDLLVLPGGLPGTDYLREHEGLKTILRKFYEERKYMAAICAAPEGFAKMGFLKGKKAVSHPCRKELLEDCGAIFTGCPVECDENIVTGCGLGTAIDFSLKLVELLVGKEEADKIGEAIVYKK